MSRIVLKINKSISCNYCCGAWVVPIDSLNLPYDPMMKMPLYSREEEDCWGVIVLLVSINESSDRSLSSMNAWLTPLISSHALTWVTTIFIIKSSSIYKIVVALLREIFHGTMLFTCKEMYVVVATRPNIVHAVGLVNRFMYNLDHPHWNAMKHIFRYLASTKNYNIKFKLNKPLVLVGLIDSD